MLFAIDESNKLWLTDEAKAMQPLDLYRALIAVGQCVSGASVRRALTRGWMFSQGDRSSGRRRASIGFVRLTSDERTLRAVDIRDRMGIHIDTASCAKNRGWFEVTLSNVDLITEDAYSRIEAGDLPAR